MNSRFPRRGRRVVRVADAHNFVARATTWCVRRFAGSQRVADSLARISPPAEYRDTARVCAYTNGKAFILFWEWSCRGRTQLYAPAGIADRGRKKNSRLSREIAQRRRVISAEKRGWSLNEGVVSFSSRASVINLPTLEEIASIIIPPMFVI